MSNTPAPVPPTDAIRETTEKLAAFVQWIAQLIQSRNWFTILLLLDVALIFAANPGMANKLLTAFFPQQTLPEQYPVFFWLTLGIVFVTAIAVAVRTMPKSAADATDFTERKAIAKPLILLFDQFEQFFVHHKHKSDRQPFIQALTDWYRADSLSVRIVVCIRGDMCDRLVELHQALGYSLGPQEVFRLEKFTPIENEENKVR